MVTVSRRMWSLLVVALAATGMLLLLVLPAAAQSFPPGPPPGRPPGPPPFVPGPPPYPPGPPPGLVCPPSATPGGVVPPGLVRVCNLRGNLPNQAFRVTYQYNPTVEVGEVVTNDDGEVVFDLTVSREAVGQVVTITAVAEDGTELVTLTDTFPVEGDAEPAADRGQPVTPGRPLASTGVDAALLAGIGAVLLGAGVFAVRRRGGREHEREDSRAGA